MCIAILNKKTSKLSVQTLTNSFKNNSDGGGFMYCIDNKLIIDKGYFNLNEFLQAYERIKAIADGDIVIHCRISTSGQVDVTNCHPHQVNDNIGLVHNGACIIKTPSNSPYSDTIHFIKKYMQDIATQDLQKQSYLNLLECACNVYGSNKLIIMDNQSNSYIINSKLGHYDKDGNWYSNDSYKYNYAYFYDDDFANDFAYIADKKLLKKVKKNIKKLSTSDLLTIADYPLVSLITGEIISEYQAYNFDECITLEELDYNLYLDYMEKLECINFDYNYADDKELMIS